MVFAFQVGEAGHIDYVFNHLSKPCANSILTEIRHSDDSVEPPDIAMPGDSEGRSSVNITKSGRVRILSV